eukprot:Em0001g3135a
MSTRSGLVFRVETTMAEKEAVSMSDILRLLVETQQRQVEAEQRREEERRQEQRREEERRQEQRREEGERIRREESERQLELISKLVERTEVRTRRGPSEKDVQLVRLTEKDDIETYLTTFERVMEAYEIDKSRWAFKLAPYLSGKAQQAYASLSAEEAAQYESVKEAVFHRYDIKEETYRQRFRSMRKGPGETYREQASKLNDMAKKWLKGCTTVDELLDVIVKEQLVDTLPQALKVWVSEREPSSSKEAGELADSYLQARGLERGGAGRGEHGERLSLDREQQWPRREKVEEDRKNPGDQGYPRKQEASGRRGLGNTRCYNCSKTGHLSWNCPEKALYSHSRGNDITRRQTDRTVLRSGFVEGNKVEDIVLDTGCSRTMIRRDLVPTTKILDDAVTVQCAHGDTVAYPLAVVELTVDGLPLTVEAALSDTLPTAVLLGRDVPELKELLGGRRAKELHDTIGKDEAMMVTTRYGARKRRELQEKLQEQGQEMEMEKQARSEAEAGTQNQDDTEKPKQATELEAVLEGAKTEKQDKVPEDPWKDGLDDELLEGGRVRRRMTKAQKRQERRKFWQQGKGNQDLNFGAAELRQLQHTDESLAEIRQLVKDGHPGFVEKDSLIYRVKGQEEEGERKKQLVLPKKCREAVLKMAHEIPMAGHLGRCRTTKRLLQRFYWPNIYQDVANLCRNCARCQKAHNRRAQPVPLVPLPIMSEPFSRIAMDIVGPLPRSSKGHKYILVICDYATRYPEAVPLRTCDAEAVAEELGNYSADIRTTPYHPQTDGLVERFNQTLKAMLRRTVTEEGKDWDRLLPYLLFAYREVPQASTGFSPFELLYGRAVRGPLDVIKATWKADERSNESVVSYVLCIQDRLTKMAELVKDNLEKAQETQKKWYDLNARERSFELGEKVLVLLPTSTNKLLAQWQGPYEVVKKINKVIYQVEMLNKRKRLRNFHINMLRKWHEPLATSYWVQDVGGNEELHLWNEEEEKSYEIADQLTDEQRVELRHLLEQYKDTLQDKPGRTLAAEHVIDTGTAKPVKLPPYRLPYAYRDQVQKELKEMVKDGIATTSISEWAAPIVLVTKKDGGIRFCVDYRRLNAVSAADCYPMPRVDELIDRLGTAKYISTLDLSRGYWQVPMSAESRKKTSFVTPFGQFEFNVMPFGLHGAPSTFQRMMDQVLQGLETWSAAYIDDVVVQGATWSEHNTALAAVLKRLQEAGLTAKPSKCHFGMDECTYLGHIVGNGHVRPEKGKVAAVEAFPVPKTKKDVRAFLGLTGYYRKFIPEYATIAAPLTELTKKEQPNCLAWSSGCAEAFEALKRHLCTSPVLKCPNFGRPFVLQTDASDWGVGAVLSQKDDDDNEHPVAYFSKKLLPRERRYSTIEKECLAIKLATHAFRVYLLGKPFTVQTDHHALEWLDRLKEDNARLTRWSLALQPYQFTVKYRPGKLNGNADALSRQASLSPEEG